MGAPTGGGKGGAGGGGMKPMGTGVPMPQMAPGAGMTPPIATSAGGMGTSTGVRPSMAPPAMGQGQPGAMGQAMNPAMQQRPMQPQQDIHSILGDVKHPDNPLSQIGGQMKNMMSQGEGVIKNIFSGQWKDSLGLSNSQNRTQGILGGSIANPYKGPNPSDVPNINNPDGTAGLSSTTSLGHPAAQASTLPGVSPMTNPQTASEAMPSPVVNVGNHIADTQQKLTSYIQSAPEFSPGSNDPMHSFIQPVGATGTPPTASPQPVGLGATLNQPQANTPQSPAQAAQLQQARTPQQMMTTTSPDSIGNLAASYEVSALKGKPIESQVGFISGGMGGKDPGGISYGRYQLETNKGTMQGFLKSPEGQQFSNLQGVKINSPEFRSEWQKTAAADPHGFDQAQFNYIKTKDYDKAVPYASAKGFDTENPAIQQALFSTANQSGGWKNIINKSGVRPGDDAATQINKLYDARASYFRNLDLSPDVKSSIIKNRTIDERQDALALLGRRK